MKHNWEMYTRGTIHPIKLSMVLFGAAKYGAEYNGGEAGSTFYCNLGPKMWFAWDRDELEATGKHILAQTSTPEKRKRHFAKMQQAFDQAVAAVEKIRAMDLTSLSDEELASAYEAFLEAVWPPHGFLNSDVDAVDILPAERLKARVKRELGVSEEEFVKLWRVLSSPAYESYLQAEKKMLLEVAQSKDYKKINEIVEKYWWTVLGWETLALNTKGSYLAQIKEIEKTGTTELEEIQGYVERIKKEKRTLFEQYKLSEETQYQIDLFEEYTYWHDMRKEMQCKTVHATDLFVTETARRHGFEHDDLEWLWHDELLELMRTGKTDTNEIEIRKKAVGGIASKGAIERWSGEEALRKKEEVVPSVDDTITEVKGESASPGAARGTAKVCAGAREALAKVEDGDILICGMTLPEYVPAMKRAAAIVTDEGGITCHAAIVARELKKPCVIATRIATEVFKDGDLVEVDAEKGVVRRIG